MKLWNNKTVKILGKTIDGAQIVTRRSSYQQMNGRNFFQFLLRYLSYAADMLQHTPQSSSGYGRSGC